MTYSFIKKIRVCIVPMLYTLQYVFCLFLSNQDRYSWGYFVTKIILLLYTFVSLVKKCMDRKFTTVDEILSPWYNFSLYVRYIKHFIHHLN